MRVAAIDMGTNSFHLLVAEIAPDGAVRTIEKGRVQVMLGQGGMEAHRIVPEAFERGLQAMQRFADTANTLGACDIHAAATSAIREASNGAEFCRSVKMLTQVHVRVVPGREEGRLIWVGARADLDLTKGPVLLCDLGGGSTELVHGDKHGLRTVRSLPVGHLRLADRYLSRTDRLTRDARRAIKQHVRGLIAPVLPLIPPSEVHSLVGTSGTIRCLARMASLQRGDAVPAHDHGLLLHRAELEALLERMESLSREELVELPGMDAKRKDTLAAGAVVVREVMKAFGADHLVTSERSLRDGLIVDWVERHRPEIDLSRDYADPRERSIRLAMQRFGVDEVHAEHVTGLALTLFDATLPLHKLTTRDRTLLRAAGLLHDIGHHVAGKGHHKHGQYLLEHIRMWGFTAPELALVGQLVRYHSGSRPKATHPTFQAMAPSDRERVRVLAGLLRVADGLDRSHTQPVQSLDVSLEARTVRVVAQVLEGGELERWSASERADLLTRALGRTVEVELVAAGSVSESA